MNINASNNVIYFKFLNLHNYDIFSRYGRRIPLIVSMIICGAVMIFGPFVPHETGLAIFILILLQICNVLQAQPV